MNWTTAKLAAETLCLLTVAASAGYAVWDMHQTQVQARASIVALNGLLSGAQQTVTSLNQTVAIINRPCASLDAHGKLLQDGPICELDQAIHDIRKIATASGKQVQQTGDLITASANAANAASMAIQNVTPRLGNVADQATTDLTTLNERLKELAPLETNASKTLADFDALLTGKDLRETLDNANRFTANAADAVGNVALLSHDFQVYAHPILNPDKCKTRKCTAKRVIDKVFAYTGLAAEAEETTRFWAPLRVKLAH